MALSSVGYDGTVDELGFAQLMNMAGARYAVNARTSFAATQVNGVRSVSLSAGQAYAPGVRTVSDSAVVVPLPAPTAGQWHLIVLRRNWETNTQSIEALTNATYSTTAVRPNLPPTSYPIEMATSPGSRDDQPLWWAWVNNANVTVALVDLRSLPLGVPKTGTAAQRDAYYGVPTLAMQQSALDGATWENTQYNRTERYFGYGSSVHPGWYPVAGMMPAIRTTKSSGATITSGAAIIVWTDATFYNGDDFIGFTPGSTTFTLKRTGLYRVTFRCALGGPVVMIQRGIVNSTVLPAINHDTPGNANAFPKATLTDLFRFEAGDVVKFDVRAAGGNADMDLPQCFALIEFVSPRLT
jgi:hypothetical protein